MEDLADFADFLEPADAILLRLLLNDLRAGDAIKSSSSLYVMVLFLTLGAIVLCCLKLSAAWMLLSTKV